ncbi:Soluble lamin-associated protein of 75 kDa [Orchesella cincta]|uniref:Soluble lamin-associated protein of 75 kDa n=1 Tax=Orchesella cincta TaxID=48709 RepID=A0A1D2M5S0_ORCCI|nr:Soluble lamin-associated protein of 75 kDa [Orchesella cincta]
MKNSAAGFYTAKPRGSLDAETMEWYSMAVLDTLFIRKSYRRKGYALSSIEDLLLEFPDQNVGLSFPISLSMKKVASKYLNMHPRDRMKLWEITGCGSEGNCQILWYLFKRCTNKEPEA